ncbi:MAG: hypothetical protein ACJA09_003016 [Alcanivorax sp.]
MTYAKPSIALFESVDGPFNAPTPAHTYDNSEFLPIRDRFITFGGAAFNTGRFFELTDSSRTGPYMWDLAKVDPSKVGGTAGSQVEPGTFSPVLGGQMWENRDNLQPQGSGDRKPGYGGTFFIDGTTAYATENGLDVLYILNASEIYKYTVNDINDSGLDTYERVGRYIRQPFSGQGAGAYDPGRKIFLRIAGVTFTYWTLDNPGDSNENTRFIPVVTSGTFDRDTLKDYGLDFDPQRNHFVLWNGQSEVWSLTPPAILEAGDSLLAPMAPQSAVGPDLQSGHTGILGKWKYVEALDTFLGAVGSSAGKYR